MNNIGNLRILAIKHGIRATNLYPTLIYYGEVTGIKYYASLQRSPKTIRTISHVC